MKVTFFTNSSLYKTIQISKIGHNLFQLPLGSSIRRFVGWSVGLSVGLSVCLSLKTRSTRLMAIGLVSLQISFPNLVFKENPFFYILIPFGKLPISFFCYTSSLILFQYVSSQILFNILNFDNLSLILASSHYFSLSIQSPTT